ncbi:hypothetical protein [Salegentibacter sp. Hel_I_6]|uniref:hypothetical protein n=1 Tax=Salegentibacter sp. Hel_I_6 TaxID=1250278 RepID=UPI000564809E|nr:hypothetical protein [Salegentibacter sp. Hel_I_6]
MGRITINLLEKEVEEFKVQENNSYLNSYQEFIKYFDNISRIEKHHLIISAHFIYGWMPTIINLRLQNLEEVLRILNKVKAKNILKVSELQELKHCINNSLVGVSKLLHFINPEIYPIWDSKIYRFWSGKKTIYGIQDPQNYLLFLKEMHLIANNENFQPVKKKVESQLKYEVSGVRALELIIFQKV